ncbi:hypothetical protein K501DRAFT_233192 [Backusella circina FSU 941]|nr:hypothetical protein K501DRAFT_234741 [Backusella circina FSU 941]KAI8875737.1 hypothetical protein K501DRAFT_233192 [Backusella circina FSU 941]
MEKITKTLRHKRSQCSRKKLHLDAKSVIEYPPGPILINPSWNPVNRNEKPPYSYATIIAHALLSSDERKLTLNDIYVWITKNYPFYSNDTQGWQNSIRHNLSLHKSFVKIERDPTAQSPPRKGCFWTIRSGQEGAFIENLQKPTNPVRKQLAIGPKRSLKRGIEPTSPTTPYNTFRASSSPTSSPISFNSKFSQKQHSSPQYHPLPPPTTSYHSSNNYHVPEYNVSYQVYPDHPSTHDDLFGCNNDDTLTYSQLTDTHPPSLSPCDTYSTTSSYADTYVTHSGSQDFYHNYAMFTNDSIYYPYKDYAFAQKNQYRSKIQKPPMMDWTQRENLYADECSNQPEPNHLYNKSYFTDSSMNLI